MKLDSSDGSLLYATETAVLPGLYWCAQWNRAIGYRGPKGVFTMYWASAPRKDRTELTDELPYCRSAPSAPSSLNALTPVCWYRKRAIGVKTREPNGKS